MTLREILNEAVSVELISAGTGKEIARTGTVAIDKGTASVSV